MGHYTRFTFWGTTQEPTAVEILDWMVNDSFRPVILPDHPLFKLERGESMLHGPIDGFHQIGESVFRKVYGAWCLNVDTAGKFYHRELESFLDWFSPYDAPAMFLGTPEFRGFIHYELGIHPTLIYRDECRYLLRDLERARDFVEEPPIRDVPASEEFL